MNEQQKFQQQRVVDACTTLGEILGRILAAGLQLLERFIVAPEHLQQSSEVDFLDEFNRKAAARFLMIGTTKLDEDTKAGLIAARRVGNQLMFIRAELERYGRLHVQRWAERTATNGDLTDGT